jgi:hypothetical protein
VIAHVAEASEASGRVLMWLDPDAIAMPQTLKAAVAIASAYAADIETLVLDAPSACDVVDVPAAHVSLLGKLIPLSTSALQSRDRREVLRLRQTRDAVEAADRAHVRITHTLARGDAIDRLADMCLARGPWNIVAVSRPPGQELPGLIAAILANVSGATGVVVAGRNNHALAADIVVILEDAERMPSMLRAAERLLGPKGRIHVMVAAETPATYEDVDSQARLLTADDGRYLHRHCAPSYGVPGAFDGELFRIRPSFVIARFGGTLLGQPRALTRLLALASGPMLLVR